MVKIEHVAVVLGIVLSLATLIKIVATAHARATFVLRAIEGDDKSGQESVFDWQHRIEAALMGKMEDDGTLVPGILQRVEAIHTTVDDHGASLDEIKAELMISTNGNESLRALMLRTHHDLRAHLTHTETKDRDIADHMQQMREALLAQGISVPPVRQSTFMRRVSGDWKP